MNGIRLISRGALGADVESLFREMPELEGSSLPPGTACGSFIVADYFDAEWIRSHRPHSDECPFVLAFTTNRGLFVSCWLDNQKRCFECFQRRWYSNLAFWEGSAQVERLLVSAERRRPGLRAQPLLPVTAHLALQLFSLRQEQGWQSEMCDYIDLVTAGRTSGALLPVHGCRHCYPRSDPWQRYVRDLEELLIGGADLSPASG